MSTKHVDWLNIGLIVLSLLVAFLLPFRMFLYAYATLGPLHYLTEINWLRDKQYFVNDSRWLWPILILAVLIVVPKYFVVFPAFSGLMESGIFSAVINWMNDYSTGLIFTWLLVSAILVFTRKLQAVLGAFVVGFVIAGLLNFVPLYVSLVGLMLPTLIHVYLFTMLFMLYGAVKSKSTVGYAAVVLLLLCPLIVIWMPVNPDGYFFSDLIKQTFKAGNFHITNANIAKFLGLGDGKSFFFYEIIELKLQIFIAFAYTYHYLNWFSKTTVIKWHENLNVPRTVIIGIVWLGSAGLFWYDYTIGFWLLLLLSILHVLLEFPLNVVSIRGIASGVAEALRKGR